MANLLAMKNIWHLFKIHPATYILILSFLFTGLIKNIILIYLIIFIHELGHVFIIKTLKYKILQIDIYPSGGVTKIDKPINTKISHDLLIASFGILFQIILSLIFKLLFYLSYIRISTYELFLTYNTTILIFNLLPIIPLDGYQILRCIGEIFFPYQKAFKISFIISAISIICFATYTKILSLNNYLIISFLLYKIIIELKNFKYQKVRFELERHLYYYPYQKIRYEKLLNLSLLKKNTYHYFKSNNTYLSEKKILKKKYSSLHFHTFNL